MHQIEPYYNWRDYYIAAEDERSPFYGRDYNEMQYHNQIYNYYIHPLWDDIGSGTLYLKVLFADYENQFAIIEFIGEWNDCINNDIMYVKRNVIDPMVKCGINKFVLLGENVLNFHCSDDSYYEEWYDDIREEGGWIAAINFRDHVLSEMRQGRLHHYVNFGTGLNSLLWRKLQPAAIVNVVEEMIVKALR